MLATLATLRVMPLPLAVFVLCATAQGVSWTSGVAFAPAMMSGVRWQVSYGDIFVFGSLIVLFVEIMNSVNTDARSILNHSLSTLVALVCIVLFVTTASFTNSAFFMLITMMLIDVIAGFVITIVSARRDFGTS
ncbi:MAG: hypothetical protein ACKVRO_01715 [Micropepsaceae bacterium]